MIVPIAATAAVAVPEIAPNTPDDKTSAAPSPPLRPRTSNSMKPINRRATPPDCIRYPARTNSGRASKITESNERKPCRRKVAVLTS